MRSVLDSLIRYHRRVQSQAQDDTALDTDEMLEKLCWLVIDGCKTGCEVWEYLGEEHTGPHNLGLSTLSAATYFGYASLARELLDQDMVRLCLYPSSRVLPEGGDKEKEMLILGCKPGSMERSPVKGYILGCMLTARSAGVYQYLENVLGPAGHGFRSLHLSMMARAGDTMMVRYQLDNGARTSGIVAGAMSLGHAVRACNGDLVDLLLEHGAAPNEPWGTRRHFTPLTAAAQAGSMVLMRKLLDAGAKLHDPDSELSKDRYTLFYAPVRAYRNVGDAAGHGAGLQRCEGHRPLHS
ncbi:hypothetical protein OQA88_3711 [Cercophora sp. LCS_1]